MHKLLLVLGFFLFLNIADAQVFKKVNKKSDDFKYVQIFQSLQRNNIQKAQSKTTQLEERLVGESMYIIDSSSAFLYDTTGYIYCKNNKAVSNFDYDIFTPPTIFSYSPPYQLLNNGINDPYYTKMHIPADTVRGYYIDSQIVTNTTTYEQVVIYDSNRDVTFLWDSLYSPINTGYASQCIVNYDPHNKLVNSTFFAVYTDSLGNSFLDSAEKRSFIYNNQGQLVADSVFDHNYQANRLSFSLKNEYLYDATGNLTNIMVSLYSDTGLTGVRTYRSTYTADNRLKKIETNADSPPLYIDFLTLDSLGYTPGIPYYTYQKYFGDFYVGGTYYSATYFISPSGILDSVVTQDDDGVPPPSGPFISYSKGVYKFDSYNNPVSITYSGYDNFGNNYYSANPAYYFYYELFDPSSVKNVTETKANLMVFPNPSHDLLYIAGINTMKEPLQFSLVNATGQLVMIQAVNANDMQMISLSKLVPGLYTLSIIGATGSKLYSQKIIRQ